MPPSRSADAQERRLEELRACLSRTQGDAWDGGSQTALRLAAEGLASGAEEAQFAEAAGAARALATAVERMMADRLWDQPRVATLASLLSALFSPEITPGSETSRALAAAAIRLAED